MIASLNGNMEASINVLFDRLPPQTRASSLCETYLEQASWAFRPIKRDEIMEDITGPIYKALRDREAGVPITWFSPHKLSVLYLIFALGALVDLTLEPCESEPAYHPLIPFNETGKTDSKEAENYYNLSRVALTLRSVFDSPEISAVQAILLTAGYHAMAGRRYTMDSSVCRISHWPLASIYHCHSSAFSFKCAVDFGISGIEAGSKREHRLQAEYLTGLTLLAVNS